MARIDCATRSTGRTRAFNMQLVHVRERSKQQMGANLFKLHGQRANGNLYILLWVDFCLFAARFTGMSRMPQSSSSRTPSKTKVLIPPASRSRAASPSISKPSSSTVSPTRARTKSTPQTPSKSLRRAQPQDQPPVPKTPVNIREAIALKRAEVKKTERASSSCRNGGTSDDLTALDDALPTKKEEDVDELGRWSVRETIERARSTGEYAF